MAPTLLANYAVDDTGANTAAIVTPSFTPAVAEVLVAKLTTWDTTVNYGTGPSGGGLTWTKQVEGPTSGFAAYAAIWTAVVGGSPSSMTVSATPSAASRHSMVVERWQGQLAATPAVNGTTFGNRNACTFTVTTAAAGSVVSWTVADANSKDPTSRVYLSSATEEHLYDRHLSTDGVWYYAYQAAASAGSQPCGLSAPTGMIWSAAAIEIQSPPSTAPALVPPPISQYGGFH